MRVPTRGVLIGALAFAVMVAGCGVQLAGADSSQAMIGVPTGWGANSVGAFGPATGSGPAPVKIPDEGGTTQASMGCSHALYRHADGTVWASGWNNFGQLGSGDSVDSTAAVHVLGLTDVVAVAAGCYHSMALEADGTVWVWGQNQLVSTSNPPDGTCPGLGGGASCFLHPTQWLGPTGITRIAAGTLDEIALAADGTVFTGGQIGNAHMTLPDPVADVAMQAYKALAVTTSGHVYTWGCCPTSSSPGLVAGIAGFATAIAGGSLSGYAVTSDGNLWAWGDDRYGQLGDGGTAFQSTALKVPGLPPVVTVAAGFFHALALDASGGLWSWGDNVDGEVGPQQPLAVGAAPSRVPGISKALGITAGGYSTIALVRRVTTSLAQKPVSILGSVTGLTLTFTATLTARDSGDPVVGVPVEFSANGVDLCTGMTNATGAATCDAPLTDVPSVLVAGTTTATYLGNADYEPSAVTTPVSPT